MKRRDDVDELTSAFNNLGKRIKRDYDRYPEYNEKPNILTPQDFISSLNKNDRKKLYAYMRNIDTDLPFKLSSNFIETLSESAQAKAAQLKLFEHTKRQERKKNIIENRQELRENMIEGLLNKYHGELNQGNPQFTNPNDMQNEARNKSLVILNKYYPINHKKTRESQQQQ